MEVGGETGTREEVIQVCADVSGRTAEGVE